MTAEEAIHPGLYIKKHILPAGLSVKDAAALIGVGRPALSNLLNGNASLSPEMAVRIEKAFGAKAKSEELLRRQADYDKSRTGARAGEIAVRTYARSLMNITANEIAAWSEKTEARALLPALLRSLVNTTAANLTKIDFPAHDNAQRHGWDGYAEAGAATPWIPSGMSGWEFGCDQRPQKKAEQDYANRVDGISPGERHNITFVFVTPKNWPGKNEWASEKRATKQWKDVRVFDASDLEQWLEQSVPSQGWFAEILGKPTSGILSLQQCWERWANVTKPALSKELFRGAIEAYRNGLASWLKNPPERPFIVAADSIEEALAFTACALEEIGDVSNQFAARAAVLQTVEGFTKAIAASPNFIAILASPDVESNSAGVHTSRHTIIVRRRNAVEGDADISLDLLDDKTFKAALVAMGMGDDEIRRYERESGQSPTILRRRLSQVDEIKSPPWARDTGLARKLVPLALAGVWNSQTEADQEILKVLTGESSYPKIEERVVELLRCEQTPMWSIGRYRGVASKIDALYAVHRLVTPKDLDEFFFTARVVLSEEDPALDLPEDKRWMAGVYGKTRNHSAALRKGLCETLVLLAVHGNNLFRERMGRNIEAQVGAVVRDLLTPVRARTWASQQDDLPRYAEAAPDVFLDVLTEDLDSETPEVLHLLRPASSGVFGGGCPRSGLLWALESLAWGPQRLVRVASLLARLSAHPIDDNWANKPERSLEAIFRAWMPQTAATIDQRIATLEILTKQYPEVMWRICVAQFDCSPALGMYSHRPDWRNDASGAGQPIDGQEVFKMRRKALDLALAWPSHDERTLGDLVAQVHGLPDEDQEKVWQAVKAWAASTSDDARKAGLRERIRVNAFTRRGRRKSAGGQLQARAKEAYDLLVANDLVVRHHWLFAKHWVDESFGELDDDKFDYKKREEKIAGLRSSALKEIWKALGYEGVLRLIQTSEACNIIGWNLADGIVARKDWASVLDRLVSIPAGKADANIENCIAGVLLKADAADRDLILKELVERFMAEGTAGEAKIIRLLKCAPFRKETWRKVDGLASMLRAEYWRQVVPRWDRQEHEELNELLDRLLEVNRPRAALHAVHLDFNEVETPNLIRLLKEIATNGSEPAGHYQLEGYTVSEAFKTLPGRGVAHQEMAHLEFLYLSALEHSEHGIPHLERQLSESPSLFMEAIALVYRRKDGGEDPPEWRRNDDDARASIANQAYSLIHRAKRIPGTEEDGTINVEKLKNWIVEVRALCKTYGRVYAGDHSIGELLSKSKPGVDGIWPNEAVRQVLEETGTKDIADGMALGLCNSRGAHWRGPGGDQERELAAKYRKWSQAIAFEHPFTSGVLEQIAQRYDHEAKWQDTDENIRKRVSN